MSTIIIVLLVIVLVVAIVLKKRADSQGDAAPKKGASKTTKKAATKPTSRTVLVKEEEPTPSVTTPIPESLRQSIQQSIQKGNYQTAEAQINQALKQDNTQHELYLLLLDIHLLQKDDFAIDHLVKHIRTLQLHDILHTAESKQREYENNKQPDAIEFNSGDFQSVSSAQPTNTTDFNARDNATTSTAQSFQDLQSEYGAPAETKQPEPAAEVQPLDFDFSFEPKNESPTTTPAAEAAKEQAPLDFSLDFESTPTPKEAKPTLDFNLSDLDTQQQEAKTEPQINTALDFNFEQPQSPAAAPVSDKTDFAPQPEVSEAVVANPAVSAQHDPLAQSFPELQQLDEGQLNLDLAEQYIELGAYESARILLKNSQTLFNAGQQQQSEKLLNRIAS